MADGPPTPTPDRGLNEVKQDNTNATAPKSQPAASQPHAARKTVKRSYSGKKETMNGPLYMQASNNVVIVRRLKRNGDGAIKQLTRWFVENQIGTSPQNSLALELYYFLSTR